MKKIILIFSLTLLIWGCKDEFNLPKDNSVNDTENPTISIVSPAKGQTYSGVTKLPITINFSDDYQIDEIQVQLSPINFTSETFSVTKKIADKTFLLDTFYTIPTLDSVTYDVLIVVNDASNNITTESYQFTSNK